MEVLVNRFAAYFVFTGEGVLGITIAARWSHQSHLKSSARLSGSERLKSSKDILVNEDSRVW